MNKITTKDTVFTLAEAAKFLRIKKGVLQELAKEGKVPARRIGDEWRFSHQALEEWLRGEADSRSIFLAQVGAFKDDETLMPMLEEIYRARGRPLVEERDNKR